MKNALRMVICLVLVVGFVSGCDTVKRAGKATKKFYVGYIEPQPTVDTDVKSLGEAEERRLAKLLKPVDERLDLLRRYVEGRDVQPNGEWFQILFQRFPWISAALVTDTAGSVLMQQPTAFAKPENLQGILELGIPAALLAGTPEANAAAAAKKPSKTPPPAPWEKHAMRGGVAESGDGAYIFLAQPYYKDNEWKGMTIVYVDPAKLVEPCPAPEDLIVLSPKHVLWAKNHTAEASAMAQQPWERILVSSTSGTWGSGGKGFFWIGRELGTFHIVYAAPSREEPAGKEQQAK